MIHYSEGMKLEIVAGVASWSYEGTELWSGPASEPSDPQVVEGLNQAMANARVWMWNSRTFREEALGAFQMFDPQFQAVV